MKRTEYLYGHTPEKYADLQVELCLMKIADAKVVLTEIRLKYREATQDDKVVLQKRYLDIEDAIRFNRQLIDEAKGTI